MSYSVLFNVFFCFKCREKFGLNNTVIDLHDVIKDMLSAN